MTIDQGTVTLYSGDSQDKKQRTDKECLFVAGSIKGWAGGASA